MSNKKTAAAEKTTEDKAVEDKVAEGSPEPDAERKTVKRRPVWVCVPVVFEDMVLTDAEGGSLTVRRPTRYAVAECPGGKGQTDAIRAVLKKHQIDPTNFEHVLMFRAEPLRFAIESQLIVRFGEEIL